MIGPNEQGIVLLSGGLDSSLVLAKVLNQSSTLDKVVPMFINYNQWPLVPELEAVKKVCKQLQAKSPVIINMSTEGEEGTQIGSVWGRSIAMVGIASMWAYTHGDNYDYIALGSHEGDVGPDCKPGDFDVWLNGTLFEGTNGRLRLELPISSYDIEDIGRSIVDYKIPFQFMYSCYWHPVCGYKSENETYRCPGCRRKTLAMKAGGVSGKELLDFPNGNFGGRTYQSSKSLAVGY